MGNIQHQNDYAASLRLPANEAAKADPNFAFYGVDVIPQVKKVATFGDPIPGYSGVNRRVQADNVFGMTYAEARRMADESQIRIDDERKETLKETSMWK